MTQRTILSLNLAAILVLTAGGWLGCTPRAAAAETEPKFVIVAKDGGAGGYEAFPDVCRLKDGRLMCVFYASYDHVGLPKPGWPNGGRIAYCLSSDEGHSWSKPEVLFDGPVDDRDSSIVQLKNGRLICNFFSLRRNASPDQPLLNPYEEPHTPFGTWIVTSDDAGKTWSHPAQIVPGPYVTSSPIRELNNGRLILGLYHTHEERKGSNGAVIFSDDDGATWSLPIDIPNHTGLELDAETDVIQLKNGTLWAAQRSTFNPLHYATSTDLGKTWSESQSLGFRAYSPYLFRTRDGKILLGYRGYDANNKFITALRYSLDECATWSDPVMVDDVIGAYPSMVDLKDGSVLIVYYEDEGSCDIRARRFRVTDAGIEFLPLVAQ